MLQIESETLYPNLTSIQEARKCPRLLTKNEMFIEDDFYKVTSYDM